MGTHYKGSKEEVRALNAYIALLRAAESVTARTSGPMTDGGLTVSQFNALEALLHLGPLHQSELARKLLKTSGNMTMVVDNLEKRGLVTRKRDASDRRVIVVHLTEAGRRLVQSVFPKVVQAVVADFATIKAAEQDELRRICKRLGIGDDDEAE